MSSVYFVGCGPGDPELVTVKAQRLIREADVVVYSGSLIPKPILDLCQGTIHDASGMIREDITSILYKAAASDLKVIRLHDGDPTIYGAIKEQIDALQSKGVQSVVIPGVTSMLASAAALSTQLTLPGITQTIIITRVESRTDVPEKESIASLASHGSTMVLYLSIHLLHKIVQQAISGGYKPETPVAVIYRASWDDQVILKGTLDDITSKVHKAGITRTAIIIIGDVINPKTYEYSRLYDKTFSHGFRKAKS